MFRTRSFIIFKTIGNGERSLMRSLSTQERHFKEVSLQVPWGQVSGKWWEPYDTRPILTIHGWQDNCGSFDRLVPMLSPNVGFLAIDLPGHGYSSRLPQGIYYNNSSYLLTIRSIKNYFNWPKISLMGHSLGGILCYIFTMLYTAEVDFLVCLDGVKPLINKYKKVQLAKCLSSFLKYNEQAFSIDEPPSYTMKEIVNKVCKPNSKSLLPEYAKYMIKRNIAPSKLHEGQFYFTRDPRLKSFDSIGFSQDELIQFAQNIKLPTFIAKFKNASYYEAKENFYEVLDILKRTSIDCDFHYVDGTHHAHLNNPQDVASLATNFIERHNIEDRSYGGLTDEIIIEEDKYKLQL